VIVLEKNSNSKTYSRWQTKGILRVLSPFSYIVEMPNESRRHLHANRVRKLVTDVCQVVVVRKQNTDFDEISSVPVNEPDMVPK